MAKVIKSSSFRLRNKQPKPAPASIGLPKINKEIKV
jgi:hypothetical protein